MGIERNVTKLVSAAIFFNRIIFLNCYFNLRKYIHVLQLLAIFFFFLKNSFWKGVLFCFVFVLFLNFGRVSRFLTCHCHKIDRAGAFGLLISIMLYDFCEHVKFRAISLKYGILMIPAKLKS